MTRWEQPADDPYSWWDHMDGRGEPLKETLAAMTPEQRREAVDKDTTIQPTPEPDESPASRRVSFRIAIAMLIIVLAEIVYLIVVHP